MRYYETPVLVGTTEEKVEQIAQYLFRQVNDLNYNLENTTAEKFWQQTADALTSSTGEIAEAKSEEQLRRDEYNALRALILKSATAVLKTEDSFSQTLQGAYLAESDFGSFMEQGFVNINGSPYTIAQLYRYQSTILSGVNEYKTELEGYIETGVLDKTTDNPVFGMDIGYHKNSFIFNGTEYKNESPSKIRITPTKIGFYEGDYEVAYIEKKAVYFPVAHITGGSIEIGDHFSVNNDGDMKAANADIEGTIRASKGYIGGFEITGSTAGNFWPCSIASIITPSDGVKTDDYQYVVFLRGNYDERGKEFGALDTTHNVIGIKKRASTVTTWDNDESPYVFYVSVKGNLYCNEISAEGRINGKYIKANSSRIAFGATGDFSYSKTIEFLTSGEVHIGKFAAKVKNIYLLPEGEVRIGQYSDESADSSSDNYPPTESVKIEAKTRMDIGSAPTSADKTEAIYFNAKDIFVNSVLKPVSNYDKNLGSVDNKWNYFYSRFLSTHSTNLIIGTRGEDMFKNPIYIRTEDEIFMGQDDLPNKNVYVVAKNTLRIGQYNDTLKTSNVYVRGTTITIYGGTINLNGTVKVNGTTIS